MNSLLQISIHVLGKSHNYLLYVAFESVPVFVCLPFVLATPSYWFCRKLGAGDTVSGSGHAGDGRSFRHVRLRLLLHARTLSHQHEVSIRWTMLFCKDGHDDDHFYIALFSALEQTHCALLACDSK